MTRTFAPLVLAAAAIACATSPSASTGAGASVSASTARASVRPGVEVFVANPPAFVQGKRLGLITNHSGMDRQRRATIDLLAALPGTKVVALFAPEHGIRGVAESRVETMVDEKTGIPIYSLYGETRKPTPEMMKDVDVLIFDIQDIGVRQYTYESTMVHGMQAAAEKGIPFVVLDRPNPITGTIIEGNILEPEFQTFIGIFPVASRHGMTVGELARMYNDQQKIGANLTVIPVEGWRRAMWWDDYDLPWVNPSPNIRSFEAEIHYPGTVFFETVNVSEGRGTDRPFEQIGAPWLNNQEVVSRMNAMNLGARFEAVDIPVAAGGRKFPGETLKGVRFRATDRNSYRPIRASLLMIDLIRKLHPTQFEWRGANTRDSTISYSIYRHAGTRRLKEAIDNGTLPQLLDEWDREAERFRQIRAPYLLYQ